MTWLPVPAALAGLAFPLAPEVVVWGVCPVVLLDDGAVAVEEEDWLFGVAVLWLDIELVELELLWLDVADGLCASELGDDGLELCAQTIAVASTAIAALIKALFIAKILRFPSSGIAA
jgi:hypothetical protein